MEIGIDIEEIERIKKAHKRWGDRFLNRIYTKREIEYCFSLSDPYPSLTGRYCAKEALTKALKKRLPFSDVELIHGKNSSPELLIRGKKTDLSVSISHCRHYAVAVVLKP